MAIEEKREQDDMTALKVVDTLTREKKIFALFNSAGKLRQDLTAFGESVKSHITATKKEAEAQVMHEAQKQKEEQQKAQKALEAKVFLEAINIQEPKETPKAPEVAPSTLPIKPAPSPRQVYQNDAPQKRYNQNYSPNQPPRPQGQGGFQKPYERKPFDGQRPAFGQQRPFTPRPGAPGAPGARPPFNKPFGPRPMGPRPAGAAGAVGDKKFSAKTARADLTSAASVFVNKERDFVGKKRTGFDKSSQDDKRINKKSLLRRGLLEEHNIEERMVSRKARLKKDRQQETVIAAPVSHAIITTPNLTVKVLSEKIGKTATDIIKKFMMLGIPTTINSSIDFAAAELVSNELGITLELKLDKTAEERLALTRKVSDSSATEKRAPIVTVLGHVDHGKTSLLDYIRNTQVSKGEAGGITQHIGAYKIVWKKEHITFIDTPGHAAFFNMRARGASITDIAILIVAADDGVKQQTIEAIKHIKKAKVPMIVAINKMDKPDANIERIKQQLVEHDVIPEEWGGDAILVPVSAKTGNGIDKLLETIILLADVQELRANSKRDAVGTVVEARLDKGLGPVANIVVQNGTLRIGDNVVSGFAFGRVRALIDDKGNNITSAGPSVPVSILGFNSVPGVGDFVQVVDEKLIKNVVSERKSKLAIEKTERAGGVTLDDFLNRKVESKKVYKLIVKGDVQGSVEALSEALGVIENEEVVAEVISASVGNISERDVTLAAVSGARIIGFNVKADSKANSLAEKQKVSIKYYNIIYDVTDDVEAAIKAMLSPKYEQRIVGHAEVRALFKISKVGTIAGCMVTDGKIVRAGFARVLRDKKEIFMGDIESVKVVKDEVKEVLSGFECGIKLKGFNDFVESDVIECCVNERIN
ncbi:MAG: translation initiation factor IF-2 [Christensenellaceae bacterium]|nr:translation initiation factor IF-2 [Christensenellaceae bacterium]